MNGLRASQAPRFDLAYLAWNTVGSYETHEGAQAAVDQLAAAGFPIEHLDIVGSELRSIERITGRMTRGRAALAGAASGLWTGLFVGLLFSMFATGPAIATALLSGLVIGAGIGALFGLAGQRALGATGASVRYAALRTTVAARYDLVARDGFAEQARGILAPQQPWSVG